MTTPPRLPGAPQVSWASALAASRTGAPSAGPKPACVDCGEITTPSPAGGYSPALPDGYVRNGGRLDAWDRSGNRIGHAIDGPVKAGAVVGRRSTHGGGPSMTDLSELLRPLVEQIGAGPSPDEIAARAK